MIFIDSSYVLYLSVMKLPSSVKVSLDDGWLCGSPLNTTQCVDSQ